MMASMREWLKANKERVVVVHCKAGKGRSGTVACSYLISEEGWKPEDALSRFTERRMRSGFGAGVSIPSQLRWIGYVERWRKHRKLYFERQIEILEVHVWGLKEGVKVDVSGYVEGGKAIKTFHSFGNHERILVDSTSEIDGIFASPLRLNDKNAQPTREELSTNSSNQAKTIENPAKGSSTPPASHTGKEPGGDAVIFRPSTRIVLPSNDVNIGFERRNKATYGWTMVTSVAYVWFNAFFEGSGPENHGNATSDGVFEIEWDAMDGIKGSARKGVRCLDRFAVVWRALEDDGSGTGAPLSQIITEPRPGEPVPDMPAADWKGANKHHLISTEHKHLGLRIASPASKPSSLRSVRSEISESDPTGRSDAGENHILCSITNRSSQPTLTSRQNSASQNPEDQKLDIKASQSPSSPDMKAKSDPDRDSLAKTVGNMQTAKFGELTEAETIQPKREPGTEPL